MPPIIMGVTKNDRQHDAPEATHGKALMERLRPRDILPPSIRTRTGIGKPSLFLLKEAPFAGHLQNPRQADAFACVEAWAGSTRILPSIHSKENRYVDYSCQSRHRPQVNVFTCEPENQQALIDVLIESARSVRHIPGWLSANIHRSLDGRQVVNY